VGAIFSQADSGTDASAIRHWAVTADEAGFHHVMAYDHVLGATRDRLTGGGIDQFGDPPYTDRDTFHEILTLFSHLAAITTTIEFVPSVIVLAQRQVPLVASRSRPSTACPAAGSTSPSASAGTTRSTQRWEPTSSTAPTCSTSRSH
jgi:hypothetical protein